MKPWKITLICALSAFFVWLFLRRVDFNEIGSIWRSIPPVYPLLFVLIALPQFALRSFRWGLLLRPFKRHIPFRSLWNFSLIGFMISYLLPGRLGEIARPVLLAEKEGIKKSQAIATVINERLFDLLTVLVLLTAYLLSGAGRPSPVLLQLKTALFFLLPLVFFVFFLVALANSPRFLPWTEKLIRACARLLPASFRERTIDFAGHFVRALRLDLGWKGIAAVGGCSLLHWGIITFSYWLLMHGFAGVRLALPDVIPFLSVIFVAAAVPTPGMAGSMDLAAKYALTGLFGISTKTAVAFTILFHFLVLLSPIALGLIALWREGLSIHTVRRMEKKDELPAVR
ncbi:MAG: flippase-like domain-containing protein [Candidatus Aminicenantes bacterium]|nr:flippase-like domain-containing protein [Candidatus Aminicenantes bacterium]